MPVVAAFFLLPRRFFRPYHLPAPPPRAPLASVAVHQVQWKDCKGVDAVLQSGSFLCDVIKCDVVEGLTPGISVDAARTRYGAPAGEWKDPLYDVPAYYYEVPAGRVSLALAPDSGQGHWVTVGYPKDVVTDARLLALRSEAPTTKSTSRSGPPNASLVVWDCTSRATPVTRSSCTAWRPPIETRGEGPPRTRRASRSNRSVCEIPEPVRVRANGDMPDCGRTVRLFLSPSPDLTPAVVPIEGAELASILSRVLDCPLAMPPPLEQCGPQGTARSRRGLTGRDPTRPDSDNP